HGTGIISVQLDRHYPLPHNTRVMCTDCEFLADIAALAEVDSARHIHVAFHGECRLPEDLVLSFGYPMQHPAYSIAIQTHFGTRNLGLVGEMSSQILRTRGHNPGTKARCPCIDTARNRRRWRKWRGCI